MTEKILITGANGYLGKKLIEAMNENYICALVRSEKAYTDLMNFIQERNVKHVEVINCDYLNLSSIKQAIGSCRYVVHLVGIIKESSKNSFELVHRRTTQKLIETLKGSEVKKICYLSILGAREDSINSCLSSKGYAEKLLLNSDIPSLILQIPMILGEGDKASDALRKHALAKFNFTFRKNSLEQPIYAGDVIQAIKIDISKNSSGTATPRGIKKLVGPEILTREDLIKQAAKVLGVKVKVFSLPLCIGTTLAAIIEKVFAEPVITRAMLNVLDHDDKVDPLPASKQLDIQLTSLRDTLEKTISLDSGKV